MQVKVNTCLGQAVETRMPIILANSNHEEERFLREEYTVLKRSGRIEIGYKYDATSKLLDLENGHIAEFLNPLTVRDVINWFVFGEPAKGLNKETDLLKVGPFKNPDGTPPKDKKSSILFIFDMMHSMQDPDRDGHSNPIMTRLLKSIMKELQDQRKFIVLVSDTDYVPPELQHVVTTAKFPLPDLAYLRSVVKKACKWFADNPMNHDEWLKPTEEEEINIARLLVGFRVSESENILARSVQRNCWNRRQNPDIKIGFDIDSLRSEKIRLASDVKGVTLVLPDPGLTLRGKEAMGGSQELINWFDAKNNQYDEEARLDGIKPPRGAVIFGPAGVGKDYTVERLAEAYGWNMLTINLGELDSKWKGETHESFMEAWHAAERCTPCFLVFSEFEKMFAGVFGGGDMTCGGGTDSKVFATFLQLMQRKKNKIFVWALTNAINMIPAPALRAGRFDNIFYMDLPNVREREEVIKVHLRLSGWDSSKLDLNFIKLSEQTDGFSCSELEHMVNEAICYKYITEGPRGVASLKTEHFLEVIPKINTVSKADAEILRQYARDQKIPTANSNPNQKQSKGGKPKKIGAELQSQL